MLVKGPFISLEDHLIRKRWCIDESPLAQAAKGLHVGIPCVEHGSQLRQQLRLETRHYPRSSPSLPVVVSFLYVNSQKCGLNTLIENSQNNVGIDLSLHGDRRIDGRLS